MAIPPIFQSLRLPVIAAPLFIISTPQLVIAQCKAGIVGSMPALNARPVAQLDDWLAEITETLATHDRQHPNVKAAPFAINLIVHTSNDVLEQQLALCDKHRVPLIITSLGARTEVNDAVHGWGGLVLHDVINNRFAHKAVEKGADGLVAVAAGAGGHAGLVNPFALVQEIRAWFDGLLALSGSIANGRAILAAQTLGADLAYIGSAFIAAEEARADAAYKQMVVEASSDDIVYSNLFTGVHGNYLKPSIVKAGLNPEQLAVSSHEAANFGTTRTKPWKDIWGCGQGVAAVQAVEPAADMVARWCDEYAHALNRLSGVPERQVQVA